MLYNYFRWNKYSDQPETLSDKRFKRVIYLKRGLCLFKNTIDITVHTFNRNFKTISTKG
ncbi:hypothetical protein N750_02505 [Legionella pneumophila str. Leg01/53]|nr:hypothetical protein N750_02505 [Legionella pneumophila str. Leg01/53]